MRLAPRTRAESSANPRSDFLGPPLSRLVPLERARKIKVGVLKGQIRYPDDFDAPLPAGVFALFEGRRAK